MKKLFKIVLLLFILAIPTGKIFANNFYEFEDFVSDMETVKSAKKNINMITYREQIQKLKENKCITQNYGDYTFIAPVCLIEYQNYFSPQESLQYLTKDFIKFNTEYQQNSYQFSYKATKPNFRYSVFDKYLEYKGTIYEALTLLYLTHENQMIKIDNYMLARLMFENYSFYSVPTNLANRGSCSLTNYRLAISKLDGLELKPGEILDLNKLISNDPRACKGNSKQSFLFYGGSCGASSQLFRLALIMPNITVLDRSGHEKRRALYYGENIMGDDAAMYENIKKFIIRNDFEKSVYFISYEKNNYIYLIGIVPDKIDDYVEITKNVNGYRSSLFKKIYNKYGTLIGNYQFDSVYSSIHRGKS